MQQYLLWKGYMNYITVVINHYLLYPYLVIIEENSTPYFEPFWGAKNMPPQFWLLKQLLLSWNLDKKYLSYQCPKPSSVWLLKFRTLKWYSEQIFGFSHTVKKLSMNEAKFNPHKGYININSFNKSRGHNHLRQVNYFFSIFVGWLHLIWSCLEHPLRAI